MEIKKKDIQAVLLILATYNKETGQPIAGLLFENIGMGLRRKLQKISKWLQAEYKDFLAEYEDAKKSENAEEEIKILLDEVVKSDLDFVSMEEIEKLQSDKNYDFDLIERIAR